MTATAHEPGTLVHVDPGTLLMERNVREAEPSPDLIDSIRAVGVLEPITAVVTATGDLLVRFGHRRTLAALEANLDSVPVYVRGTDSLDDVDEVLRLVSQRDENTHRLGLSSAEEVGIVGQLAAFGLTADQIVDQARLSKDHVTTALRVHGSPLAAKAVHKYADLTIDQAAVIADFEDDPEVAKDLIVCALQDPGQFTHKVQRIRDDAARAARVAEVTADLEAAGVTVVEEPGYGGGGPARLRTLIWVDTGEEVDAETHKTCPGHVAWVTDTWVRGRDGVPLTAEEVREGEALIDAWEETNGDRLEELEAADLDEHPDAEEELAALEATRPDPFAGCRQVRTVAPAYGCTEPGSHGHKPRYADHSGGRQSNTTPTEEEKEAAKAARRLVIENNKAWESARTVRNEWLATFAQRKTAPKTAAKFLAAALGQDRHIIGSAGTTLAAQLLNVTDSDSYGRPDFGAAAAKATDARALHIALIEVLAGYEDQVTAAGAWRQDGTSNGTGRYLRYLADCGYALSEVEEYATSAETV